MKVLGKSTFFPKMIISICYIQRNSLEYGMKWAGKATYPPSPNTAFYYPLNKLRILCRIVPEINTIINGGVGI